MGGSSLRVTFIQYKGEKGESQRKRASLLLRQDRDIFQKSEVKSFSFEDKYSIIIMNKSAWEKKNGEKSENRLCLRQLWL